MASSILQSSTVSLEQRLFLACPSQGSGTSETVGTSVSFSKVCGQRTTRRAGGVQLGRRQLTLGSWALGAQVNRRQMASALGSAGGRDGGCESTFPSGLTSSFLGTHVAQSRSLFLGLAVAARKDIREGRLGPGCGRRGGGVVLFAILRAEVTTSGPPQRRRNLPIEEDGGSPPTRVSAPGRRVYAVGDLHGDWDQTVNALQVAGLVDETGSRWTGGDSVLVQVGDILDRGEDEIAIMSLLQHLDNEARMKGGAIYQVNGNHETMNVCEDFRYVTPGGFAEAESFLDFCEEECRGSWFVGFEHWWRVWPTQRKAEVLGNLRGPLSWNPLQMRSRAHARKVLFSPGGAIAHVMGRNGVAIVVNDTMYAHGGVHPHHVSYGLERVNTEVSRWMRGERKEEDGHQEGMPFVATRGYNSIVWSRLYSQEYFETTDEEAKACAVLQSALKAAGAKRLVVGHTPQMMGVNSHCGGRVWRIDVGMSKGIMNATPQVLMVKDGEVSVIGMEGRQQWALAEANF